MSAGLDRPTGVPRENLGRARTLHVEREFLGRARLLRNALAADDKIALREMGRIAVPFSPLVRDGGTPRPEMLARAASAWEALIPVSGRLRLEIEVKKKSLNIRELRVLASTASFEEWPDGETELGLMLVATSLEVAPGRFRLDPMKLSAVSLHAVGRWFERTFRNGQAELMADLRTLALAADDARLATPGEFEVAAGDGRWVGVVMEIQDGIRILGARSFLS